MEGISSSQPEHLVLLVSKLKEVFDMCDEDEDGFIRVEHFVRLGRQFGQTDEEVKLPSSDLYILHIISRLLDVLLLFVICVSLVFSHTYQ